MKKSLVLGLALALSLGMAAVSFAATSVTFRVTVIVVSPGVSIARIGTGDVGFGTVATGSTGNFLDRVIFTNDGQTTADWSLSTSVFENLATPPVSTGWTFLTDTPGGAVGVNQVRMAGVWDYWNYALTGNTAAARALADFAANDTLTTSPVVSSVTAYGVDNHASPLADPDGNPYDSLKGYIVPAIGQRSLWLEFDAPAAGSNHLTEMVITTVTVAAAAH